jgi:hypothetical protein
MGGPEGSRGYLFQGAISILNACTENDWQEISVEYTSPNEQVDIALMADDGSVLRAIQVKSSVNLFSKDNIWRWLESLINDVSSDKYQLVLIGNCEKSANTFIKSVDKYYSNKMDNEATNSIEGFEEWLKDKNINILLMPFDESHLMGVIRDSLNRFYFLHGYDITYPALEEIAYAQLALNMFLGTKGKPISITEYEDKIIGWVKEQDHKKSNDNNMQTINTWTRSDTGKVVTPDELIKQGNTMLQIDGDEARCEIKTSDGKIMYAEFDINSNAAKNIVIEGFPQEYALNIPQSVIVNKQEGVTIIQGVKYHAKKYVLKFGGYLNAIYDEVSGKLQDVSAKAPAGMSVVLDETNKLVRIVNKSDVTIKPIDNE